MEQAQEDKGHDKVAEVEARAEEQAQEEIVYVPIAR